LLRIYNLEDGTILYLHHVEELRYFTPSTLSHQEVVNLILLLIEKAKLYKNVVLITSLVTKVPINGIRVIEIPLPDKNAIIEMLKYYLRKVSVPPEVDLFYLAEHLKGYNAGNLALLCRSVINLAFCESIKNKRELKSDEEEEEEKDLVVQTWHFEYIVRKPYSGISSQNNFTIPAPPATGSNFTNNDDDDLYS